MLRKTMLAALVAATAGLLPAAHAQTEIEWWHSMTGVNNDRVNNMAKGFNATQSQCRVNAVFKGSYDDSMTAAIAAFRAGKAPNLLQVYEVGTATMMYSKAIKPVADVMRESGAKWDPKAYVPAVASYYTSPKGEMLSFPFNSSTTVLFWNKDAFKAAGLDPNKPPKTWGEVAAAGAKLKAAGHKCPLTTSWQTWTQLESFSAWHNTLFATKDNGFGGLDARLLINGPLFVRHIENLANLAKQGIFVYGGRGAAADAKFSSGECAMTMASSAIYGLTKSTLKADFGISTLPYYPDVPGAPQNTIIGGASLWVMAGKKKEEYQCVGRFLAYLSQPQIQATWHQDTGYLPSTMAAYELTKKSGFYDKNPGTDVSVQQMIVKTTDKSRGLRLGNMVQIRAIMEEELENVWGGKKTPKQALDDAVRRGNEQLARFQKMVGGR
ncbi:MAG: sn-glycerol-3-phosphate ABC transporter substrate-binding protein UgpB [Gemmatimonadota bacterium]